MGCFVKKNLLLLILCLSTGFVQAKENNYAFAGDLVIGSERYIADSSKDEVIDKDNIKEARLAEAIKPLSKFNKRKFAFGLLSQKGQAQKPEEEIITEQGIKDLTILAGSEVQSAVQAVKQPSHLFGNINKTQTIFGQVVMARMLVEPTADVNILVKRQNTVKEMVKNTTVFNQFDQALKQIQEGEDLYLGFYNSMSSLDKKTNDKVYFGSMLSGLNNSSTALEARRMLNFAWNGIGALPLKFYWHLYNEGYKSPNKSWKDRLFSPFKAVKETVLEEFALYNLSSTPGGKNRIKHETDQIKKAGKLAGDFQSSLRVNIQSGRLDAATVKLQSDMRKLQEDGAKFKGSYLSFRDKVDLSIETSAETLDLASKQTQILFQNIDTSGDPAAENVKNMFVKFNNIMGSDRQSRVQSVTKVSWANQIFWELIAQAIWMYRIKRTAGIIGFDNAIMCTMQTKMIGIANIVRGLDKLVKIMQENPEIAKNIENLDKLINFAKNPEKISPKLAQLLDMLRGNTFRGNASGFSFMGRALVAHKLMLEVKDHFVPALEVAGQIDAYLSMAKLYKQFEAKSLKYCFVEFSDSTEPCIELRDFWNPIIGDKVVAESISFDNNLQNLMLTGPNGSGRSSLMKSIANVILCAQTFGIAPAQYVKLAPFTKINICMNAKENSALGLLTPKAEQEKIDSIKNRITKLSANDRCFTIVDDAFKGATETDGGQRIYAFGKSIANAKNSISVIATHFNKPTDLEADTNGRILNYHVELLENTPGIFVRTFKLVKGKNDWWFADDAMRARYIEWLKKIK